MSSSASELLVRYAAYHRDRRNIATHLVGIPLIVFALGLRQPLAATIERRVGPTVLRDLHRPANVR